MRDRYVAAVLVRPVLSRGRVLGAMVLAAAIAVFACTPGSSDRGSSPSSEELRPLDASLVARGESVYATNCAACHGANGEGQPNWKQPGVDGTLPAPPHDATGHTWHHADGLLFRIVRDGCAAYGGATACRMPGFEGTLSDEEIVAVIEYMRSWWGPADRAFQQQVTANDPLPLELR